MTIRTLEDRLITTKEVAELLGVSQAEVRAMAARGELPDSVMIDGGVRRWMLSAIQLWLEEQKQTKGNKKDDITQTKTQKGEDK